MFITVEAQEEDCHSSLRSQWIEVCCRGIQSEVVCPEMPPWVVQRSKLTISTPIDRADIAALIPIAQIATPT